MENNAKANTIAAKIINLALEKNKPELDSLLESKGDNSVVILAWAKSLTYCKKKKLNYEFNFIANTFTEDKQLNSFKCFLIAHDKNINSVIFLAKICPEKISLDFLSFVLFHFAKKGNKDAVDKLNEAYKEIIGDNLEDNAIIWRNALKDCVSEENREAISIIVDGCPNKNLLETILPNMLIYFAKNKNTKAVDTIIEIYPENFKNDNIYGLLKLLNKTGNHDSAEIINAALDKHLKEAKQVKIHAASRDDLISSAEDCPENIRLLMLEKLTEIPKEQKKILSKMLETNSTIKNLESDNRADIVRVIKARIV